MFQDVPSGLTYMAFVTNPVPVCPPITKYPEGEAIGPKLTNPTSLTGGIQMDVASTDVHAVVAVPPVCARDNASLLQVTVVVLPPNLYKSPLDSAKARTPVEKEDTVVVNKTHITPTVVDEYAEATLDVPVLP